MKRPVFALVDCNNFFVSCERLFRPDLKTVPIGVLSNNDGCFVSRSNELKALGVPMGAPYFKHEALIRANGVQCFSANFELYGDFSDRVVSVLELAAPKLEIYSVDESFMDLSELGINDYGKWARELAASVEKQTGIPVSIGVGPTKTLAKLASERAKRDPSLRGGHSVAIDQIVTPDKFEANLEENLRWLPLEDVWGVGRRYGPRLRGVGLSSAYDLTQLPNDWILNQMTVRGLRTVDELRGISCFPLEMASDEQERQKSIAATRSFAGRVSAYNELESAVASFAARAAVRLRRKKQLAWKVSAFVYTGKHTKKQFYLSDTQLMERPSADTADIIRAAHLVLKRIYSDEFTYKKAGVILSNLTPDDYQQLTLSRDHSVDRLAKRDQLMSIIDQINQRYQRTTVKHASEGVFSKQNWHSKRQNVSPAYQSSWSELPVVS